MYEKEYFGNPKWPLEIIVQKSEKPLIYLFFKSNKVKLVLKL